MSVEGRGGGGGGSSHRASVLEKKLNIVVDDGKTWGGVVLRGRRI